VASVGCNLLVVFGTIASALDVSKKMKPWNMPFFAMVTEQIKNGESESQI
jgi:hypothetical protein